jgi:PTS system fructose-specific IIA component
MLINENLIILNMEAKTKEEAIEKMSLQALKEKKVNDSEEYIKAVIKRESEYSTGVGFGVAIPHGKTDAVNEPFLMYATVEKLDWHSLDGEPVDLIFMIGVPEKEAGSTHLKILAGLSRKLMKEEFRMALREIKDPSALIELLQDSNIGL